MSKRSAEELTKDDGADAVANGTTEDPGSIAKASEEELASRRIVKVAEATTAKEGEEKAEAKVGGGEAAKTESKPTLGFGNSSGGFGALSKSSTEAFITKQTPGSFFSSFNSGAGASVFGASSSPRNQGTFGSGFGGAAKSATASSFGTFAAANKTTETTQFSGGMGTASGTQESRPSASFFNSTVASAPLALAKDSKVSNGEEGFAPVLEARCKLYKLVDMEKKEGEEGQTQKKYKECGEGPLRLLAPKAAAGAEAGTAQTLSRLVMRRAEIKSVILNSVLGKLSTVNKQGDKGLRFACMGEGMKLESYFFKFDDRELAVRMLEEIQARVPTGEP